MSKRKFNFQWITKSTCVARTIYAFLVSISMLVYIIADENASCLSLEGESMTCIESTRNERYGTYSNVYESQHYGKLYKEDAEPAIVGRVYIIKHGGYSYWAHPFEIAVWVVFAIVALICGGVNWCWWSDYKRYLETYEWHEPLFFDSNGYIDSNPYRDEEIARITNIFWLPS